MISDTLRCASRPILWWKQPWLIPVTGSIPPPAGIHTHSHTHPRQLTSQDAFPHGNYRVFFFLVILQLHHKSSSLSPFASLLNSDAVEPNAAPRVLAIVGLGKTLRAFLQHPSRQSTRNIVNNDSRRDPEVVSRIFSSTTPSVPSIYQAHISLSCSSSSSSHSVSRSRNLTTFLARFHTVSTPLLSLSSQRPHR